MEGYLNISDLRIQCAIGIHDYEREQKQEILVDFSCRFDCTACVQTDSLTDTLDYSDIARVLEEVAQAEYFQLLETYCHEALNTLFSRFSMDWARICVKKRALPLAAYVSIEMEREA